MRIDVGTQETGASAPVFHVCDGYVIRPVREDEDWGALTTLLHRAYAPLLEAGMRYHASHQPPEVTRERALSGHGFILERAGEVLGTLSVYGPGQGQAGCAYYDLPGVWHMGQFAVDPALQSSGLGGRLLDHIERFAADNGATELALDTSEHATHLIAWYCRRGYVQVDTTQWGHTNYLSVVMSRRLG
ncbi:MAG: GNAT family N-acetyltransferase [Burkholderiales bacterium]|nr:GNAT family N-acetyltransferase [Burkholderiales bacterium]